jgi:hypothetical protein
MHYISQPIKIQEALQLFERFLKDNVLTTPQKQPSKNSSMVDYFFFPPFFNVLLSGRETFPL